MEVRSKKIQSWRDLCFPQPRSFLAVMILSALATFILMMTILYTSENLKFKSLFIGTNDEPTSPQALSSSKSEVLLITYGRSGSTFTSALISHSSDVFFIFEPLYKKKLQLNTTRNVQNESVAIINSFLTCEFPLQYIYALENFQHTNSDSTRSLYYCLMAKKSGTSHLSCFLEFLESCRSHKITFIKTIRFHMKWVHWFMEKNPNFKLLYLIRDPRATLFSQSRVFHNFNWQTSIGNVSREHCSLIQEDVTEAEKLKSLYPHRVKGIRYENGATDPFGFTKDIYDFLGLTYNDEIARYIQNITNSTENVSNAYSILKNNSTKAMNKWRYSAGYKIVHVIDNKCVHLYKKLGYNIVQSQKHLESESPLVGIPDPGGLF